VTATASGAAPDLAHLEWPFLEAVHRTLGTDLARWAETALAPGSPASEPDVDARCRALVGALGRAGFLRYCVPGSYGGALPALDSRALCVARETLAWFDGLADFAFAMQGLGSGAITLAGSDAQRARWLPAVASGAAIAAFALSEPDAGSDVAALSTRARRVGSQWVLEGCKTWISNGGIADFYCVFARTGAETGSKGISAFVVPAEAPGLRIAERIDVIAPHPLARVDFDGCRVPEDALLGGEGEGFKLAMRTLDIFRASVAAAVDAAALLTYRAAWRRDVQRARTTREAAIAKLAATESAQRVIDAALQLHGGLGVRTGETVERLYREIRALRIYEGASEVQKLIIGRELLKATEERP